MGKGQEHEAKARSLILHFSRIFNTFHDLYMSRDT